MSVDGRGSSAEQQSSPLSNDLTITTTPISPPPAQTLTTEHLQQQQQQLQAIRSIALPSPLHDDSLSTATTARSNHGLDSIKGSDAMGTGMTLINAPASTPDSSKFTQDFECLSETMGPAPAPHQHHNDHTLNHSRNHNTHAQEHSLPVQFASQQQHARHPPRVRDSLYTRFFGLERPAAHSSVIVRSSWTSTGWLFFIRFILFLYTFTVLVADLIMTDRPRYAFCYLTQLSYLGLTSYLGTVSWHTLSEWRRERAVRAASSKIIGKKSPAQMEEGVGAEGMTTLAMTRTTTIERQHWLLTDMNIFLYHTICTFHIIVPLMYWGYLSYEGDARVMAVEISSESLWRNYSFHGGDLIVVLIEIAINTMPFIPTHLTIVFAICLLYLGEAHLVHHVDGFWIYPFLDTSGSLIWMALYIGVALAITLAFIVMYYVHRIRDRYRIRGQILTIPTEKDQIVSTKEVIDCDPTAYPAEAECNQQQQQDPPRYSSSFTVRQITRILQGDSLNQNRKRSCSNGSDVSTASTLVASDETVVSKAKEVDPPLSAQALEQTSPTNVPATGTGDRLEKVEEECETEVHHQPE
ncbi:hypothetical protein EC968_005091 [Mortierella alpina]|nr:hypothetical protein EC968_005091 [Mortierella alpina]